MQSYAALTSKPRKFFFQLAPDQKVLRQNRYLALLFLIAVLGLGAVFLSPLTFAFAQEEKRAEREAAQRAKAEAAAKQQASPEASPQASPGTAGAAKDEKKEDEDKPKDPFSTPTFNGLKFR